MGTRVSDALVAGTVMVRPAWNSFEEAVNGLVEHLVTWRRLPPDLAAGAVRSICEREAISSTAMVEIGVSIPHARLDGVAGIVAAMAVSPLGVYEVADGLAISIVTLVLSSPTLVGEHLNFLSSVSMLLQSARVRDALRNAGSVDEVLRLVRQNDGARP
jgi:mannitol/fructose-specific phosphotransferase system IIA component (Ntr-type)